MPEESITSLGRAWRLPLPGVGHDRRDAFGVADGRVAGVAARPVAAAPRRTRRRGVRVLSLTRKESGKTVTRIIPARAAAQAWAEAAEYRRFRRLSQGLVRTSDALSEAG